MQWWQSAVLGLVEGVTEYLPVSSTGHLILASWLLGLDYIPDNQLFQADGNILAVRVYDGYIDGGIYQGPVGIITRESYLKWLDKVKEEKWNIFKNFFK